MSARRLPVWAAALALGATGCGGGASTPSPSSQASSAGPALALSGVCPKAPRRLAATLRERIRRGDQLRRVFAVRSRASFAGKAPEVRGGVYFVSGDVGAVVATWAVNTRAWRTGAGLIVAVDPQARTLSPRRWDVNRRQLEQRFGISRRTDGYARARACANPTRR
jgi:hypothetical protein